MVRTAFDGGVGRATVEEFARQGYDVALPARDPHRLEKTAGELRSTYWVRTLAIPTDVADADALTNVPCAAITPSLPRSVELGADSLHGTLTGVV